MTEREVWKEEYALTSGRSRGYFTDLYHHLHPTRGHDGAAHCSSDSVVLNLSTLVTSRPSVEKICRICKQRAWRFECEPFRAVGEYGEKSK